MKTRPVLPLLTSSLLLFSGGCGFFQGNDTADQTPPPTPDSAAEAPPPVPVPQSTPLPDVDMAALGLIPPVTPAQRLSEIEKGRNNPFALIPITAKVPGNEPTGGGNGTTGGGNGTTGGGNGTTGGGNGTTGGSDGTTGSGNDPNLDNRACGFNPDDQQFARAGAAPFERPPFPREANAVKVSGLMIVGQTPFAFIQAPGEVITRSVKIGEEITRGVRVKSIQNRGIEVEQYDQTVTRKVGAPVTPPPPPLPDPITIEVVNRGRGLDNGLRALKITLVKAGTQSGPIAYDGEVVVCNDGTETIKGLRNLVFQVTKKEDGTVLSDLGFKVYTEETFLQKGRKALAKLNDLSNPQILDADFNDIEIELVEWGTSGPPTQRKEDAELQNPGPPTEQNNN